MTQLGEGISVVIDKPGNEKCVFCKKDHQDTKKAGPAKFERDMTKLKNEGRAYTIENYSSRYPAIDIPPLVKWEKDITKTGGYKAAAHHCIALKCASKHELSGEFKAAGYDPNRGSNCSWLPYSQVQFSRARAYLKPLQKHRGGHTDAYFEKVDEHLDKITKLIKKKFCTDNKKAGKETMLNYLLLQEKDIWQGLADPGMNAYHLYNKSYLDPKAGWGTFDYEKGKTEGEVKGTPSPADDDNKAEKESKNDPETSKS